MIWQLDSFSFLSNPSILNQREYVNASSDVGNRIWTVLSDACDQITDHISKLTNYIAYLFAQIGQFFYDLFFENPTLDKTASIVLPSTPPSIGNMEQPSNPSDIDSQTQMQVILPQGSRFMISAAGLARNPRVFTQEEILNDLQEASLHVSNLYELAHLCGTIEPNWHNIRYDIQNFIYFASSSNPGVHQIEYFNALRSLFKGIIFELRKPEHPIELKRLVLNNLSNTYHGCNAIRFNGVDREYKRLTGRLPNIEDIILEKLQALKEKIFIDYYHLEGNPSFLNHIRREVGLELGLNRHPIHINDPSIEQGLRESRAAYLEIFHQTFTPEFLIDQMHLSLIEIMGTEHGTQLGTYLNEKLDLYIQQNHLTEEEAEDLRDRYLEWSYRITRDGATFILLQLGLLTS